MLCRAALAAPYWLPRWQWEWRIAMEWLNFLTQAELFDAGLSVCGYVHCKDF